MSRHVDLLRLYREFQLEPGASVDDLKRAYRRHVSLVHPDRLVAKDPISQHLANERLQMLTTLYEAGMQFHRQHGRLPGAAAVRSEAHSESHTEARVSAPMDAPALRSSHRRWWLLLMVAAVLCGYWLLSDQPEAELISAPVPVRAVPVAVKASSAYDGIRRGMPKTLVTEILGAPISMDKDRWYYGPSWLRFEDGKLVEWYSSPLRRLKVSRNAADWPDAGAG
ncbi:MAG: hypothetical protein EYC71_03935 [Gammaproteobacteria bacterium]|nr:MAG: hypothetical protein EYC71_03935 [Gammaproteobacteria bacterium]